MSIQINFSTPLKIVFISLLFILSNSAFATTYYIDAISGSDSNIGTSEAQAWKTIGKVSSASSTFSPGDIIGFKRGQTFKGYLIYNGPSGTVDTPITFTSYGTGNRPILTAIDVISGTWTNEGSNKWSIPVSKPTTRLWKDGVEQKKASLLKFGHMWEEFGKIAGITWAYDSNKVYFYSSVNPSSFSFKGNSEWGVIDISGKSNINITNLDLRGGINSVIKLSDCSNIHVHHCDIGKDAGYGIVISSSDNLMIEHNSIDANFKLTFNGVASYTGTDARGVNDGIVSWAGVTNSEIRNNDFINWGHAAIAFTSSSTPVSGNKIHHNLITAPDLLYARAFGYSGNAVTNNEIYNNYIYKTSIRSQINGKNNHIHHNWIDGVINTPYKIGEQGQAFAFENYNGNPTDNILEYNTISNTEGPGIEFIASGSSSKDISGNTVQKNLFINCGTKPYYAKGTGKGIYVQGYVDVRANNFYDNAISSTLTSDTIYHRNTEVTVTEFNNRDGLDGDDIYGTTTVETLSDQGAGVLDLTTIGINADETSSSTTEGNTEPINTEPIPKTGAFIMTLDGLR